MIVRDKTVESVHAPAAANVDAKALEKELRRRVRGEVRFDDGSRALYATDGSNYRQVPFGVVLPRDANDVIETLACARRYGAPITCRGGGTSLAGQCCNVAVILDFTKYMHGLGELDPRAKFAWVQPGAVLDDLRDAAEHHHLTFAPDPSTHNHNTLGGMIGNNSCGVHSVMGGRTVDNVLELDVLTYEGHRMTVGATSEDELVAIIRAGGPRGEIYAKLRNLRDRYGDLIRARYPKIPRRVSGYSLDDLLPENGFNVARSLVGAEGTCAVVLNAKVRLVDSPPVRSLLVLGYGDIFEAGDHVPQVMEFRPTALEGMDDFLVSDMKKKNLHSDDVSILPAGQGWLLVEFGGESKEESDGQAQRLMDYLRGRPGAPAMKLLDDQKQEERLWTVRRSGLGATARIPGQKDTWEGWEDSAVPPERVGDYLRDLKRLFEKYHYYGALYGHLGQGCIHTRIDFDLVTESGIQDYRAFVEEAADLVVSYGGSLSGEHGDGQSRGELLPKMFGPELVQAFREFKAIWDPRWKMNPGKKVDPYKLDENLRLGAGFHLPRPETHFKFSEDGNDFGRATLRCVGVGECRRERGGTMCPSYMVTREEKHSTRGRAHLLFEMLRGEVIGKNGWRDENVKDALDLCLSCKGCKGDCPVNVDMATYKAEFLSHYYEGRLRPRSAYAFGLVRWWSRLAAHAPRLVNFVTQTPGLRAIAKVAAGMPLRRRIPEFAPQTFKEWWRERPVRNESHPRVILWPDTFNDHFHPEVAKAAVEVLEAAGFQVLVPEASICCGRPLYDYGLLDLAKKWLEDVITALKPLLHEGVPLVGLEPSCVAVFRDELKGLFPDDVDAQLLSRQAFMLPEFLEKKAKKWRLPLLKRKAIVQGHCHQKSIMKLDPDTTVLERLGMDFTVLDSGCCGMAGSFGFEKQHYDVSMKCGERVLLPEVRKADSKTLVIANGFSCQEQIAQGTDRKALHMAQVIQMALHEEERVDFPERAHPYAARARLTALELGLAASAGVLALGGFAWWRGRRAE